MRAVESWGECVPFAYPSRPGGPGQCALSGWHGNMPRVIGRVPEPEDRGPNPNPESSHNLPVAGTDPPSTSKVLLVHMGVYIGLD